MLRSRILLVLLLGAACLPAQSPSSRSFEKALFLRREALVERLYRQANEERRAAALPHLQEAIRRRGVDAFAGKRMMELSSAVALLLGRDAEDADVRARMNFFLYALPEIVDPKKTVGDTRRVLALSGLDARQAAGILGKKDKRKDSDPETAVDRVSLTARGSFAFKKPEGLALRFRIRDRTDVLAEKLCKDVEDPDGWLHYKLSRSFSLSELSKKKPLSLRTLSASAALELGEKGADPALQPMGVEFHVARGFHTRAWDFLARCARLHVVKGPEQVDPWFLAEVDLRAREVVRAVTGDEPLLRSYPVEALESGLALLKDRKGRDGKIREARGERLFGIPGDRRGKADALRVYWNFDKEGQIQRAILVVPPTHGTEDYVTRVMGVKPSALRKRPGQLVALLSVPKSKSTIIRVQQLLEQRFAVKPAQTTLLGIQDGGHTARFALEHTRGCFAELVLFGQSMPGDSDFEGAHFKTLRIQRAYGMPSDKELAALPYLEDRVFKKRGTGRILVKGSPRDSLGEAFEQLLR